MLDSNPGLHGRRVDGVEVIGSPDRLGSLSAYDSSTPYILPPTSREPSA